MNEIHHKKRSKDQSLITPTITARANQSRNYPIRSVAFNTFSKNFSACKPPPSFFNSNVSKQSICSSFTTNNSISRWKRLFSSTVERKKPNNFDQSAKMNQQKRTSLNDGMIAIENQSTVKVMEHDQNIRQSKINDAINNTKNNDERSDEKVSKLSNQANMKKIIDGDVFDPRVKIDGVKDSWQSPSYVLNRSETIPTTIQPPPPPPPPSTQMETVEKMIVPETAAFTRTIKSLPKVSVDNDVPEMVTLKNLPCDERIKIEQYHPSSASSSSSSHSKDNRQGDGAERSTKI